MEREHLLQTLRELDEKLGQIDAVDEQSRELLQQLMEDIQDLLDKSHEESKNTHQSLRQRVSDAIEGFEDAHPTLTEALTRVSDALGRLAH